ncbi:ribosomal RNA small subunit methyltransferase A [Candidatus Micrarchaeota archaeon]|nr:ribosomal RNA small subunit methyltransferase A [Candidatus Micrarchaeota archaeon]
MKPKKRLGQNFLLDRQAISDFLDMAEIKGRKVLEIGAGTGVVTEAIAARKPKRLVALEIDPEVAEKAKERVEDYDNAEVFVDDARSYAFRNFDIIIGSIPYYLSSFLVFKALEAKTETLFVVQKEFADRIVANPGTKQWGRLSVSAQSKAEVEKGKDIPKFSFHPIPEVDSAVIHLKPKKPLKMDEELVRALFSHKNQTVRNAFRHSAKALGMTKEEAKKAELPFSEKRVRDLTLEELVSLSEAIVLGKTTAANCLSKSMKR